MATRKAAVRKVSTLRAKSANDRVALFDISTHDVMQRVGRIREGLPASAIQEMTQRMEMTRDRLYASLGLPRSTVERKIQRNERLSPEHSERLLGLQRLVKQVERMVEESGEPKDFDAAQWVGAWLEHPQPALGGATPASLLDTMQGQELVSSLLARIQTGAYS